VLGFRDPNGIRPLVIGTRDGARGREYMLASESVALDQAGYKLLRDVAPGERCSWTSRPHAFPAVRGGDSPHAVHLRVRLFRPADSIIDNISVYKARLRMGELLAEKIKRERPEHGIDVVIPIPTPAAPARCRSRSCSA